MFNFGEKSFVGIDIGTEAIKAIEIKNSDKKPTLHNYASIKIPAKDDNSGQNFSEKFLAECLKKLIKEGKISKGNFFFSVQSFGALLTLINLPQVPEKDLEQAVQFEAHKYIPTSIDEVSLSWGIIENQDPEKSEVKQALLVAVPKNRIKKYEHIAQLAGFGMESIEIESFSLARSLVGKDTGKFMIVDIGSRVCNIILVEKGEIKASRNIDAGGRDITKAIAAGLSVDDDRAENLKASEMNFLGLESNVKLPSLDLIIGEAKRVLMSFYKKDDIAGVIDGVILSGGTANLTGLEKYFSDQLGIKTRIGNPFGRINCKNISEDKLKELGPKFSVAVGLALKGSEKK